MGCFTQVLKEADHLNKLGSGDSFVRQLQAAFSRSEAMVDLAEGGQGKKFTPTTYYTYSPRVFCSTKRFESHPLRTRCIRLDFIKTPNADQDKLDRTMNDESVWEPLRDGLYRMQLLRWQEVRASQARVLAEWRGEGAPKGRTRDKWLPLATVAALVSEDVSKKLRLRAYKDMSEQQQDAATSFDAMLLKFAANFARKQNEMTIEVTRNELYRAFAGNGRPSASTSFYAADDTPPWLKETGTTVTVDQLVTWVKSAGALLKELQRLKLISAEPKRKSDNNYYLIDRQAVLDIAAEYVGEFAMDEDEQVRERQQAERERQHAEWQTDLEEEVTLPDW